LLHEPLRAFRRRLPPSRTPANLNRYQQGPNPDTVGNAFPSSCGPFSYTFLSVPTALCCPDFGDKGRSGPPVTFLPPPVQAEATRMCFPREFPPVSLLTLYPVALSPRPQCIKKMSVICFFTIYEMIFRNGLWGNDPLAVSSPLTNLFLLGRNQSRFLFFALPFRFFQDFLGFWPGPRAAIWVSRFRRRSFLPLWMTSLSNCSMFRNTTTTPSS